MGEKLWTREFIGMGLTNFFYFMSQYIMIAALPVYIMDDLGLGEWEAGMAMTCFQIGTVVSRPLAGRVIDAVNKQRLLLIVSVLLFLLMTGFLLAYRLEIALSLRLIHGIVFALGTTASAAMAALVLPGRRKGEGIGYFAVCGNMAMVVGPLVGLDPHRAFRCVGAVSLPFFDGCVCDRFRKWETAARARGMSFGRKAPRISFFGFL